MLQSKNRLTQHALLSEQAKRENYAAVAAYDAGSMGQGYLCSTSDYFLALVSDLFRLTIEHNYNGVVVQYIPDAPRKTLRVASDAGHFQNADAGLWDDFFSGPTPLQIGLGVGAGLLVAYLLQRRRPLATPAPKSRSPLIARKPAGDKFRIQQNKGQEHQAQCPAGKSFFPAVPFYNTEKPGPGIGYQN